MSVEMFYTSDRYLYCCISIKIAVIGGYQMNICGETVSHITFGQGKIIDFTDPYVTVLFDSSKAKKEFIYPSAFGKFLVLSNKEFQSQIEADNEIIEQKLAATRHVMQVPRPVPKPPEKKRAKPKLKAKPAAVIAASPDKDKV